MFILIVSTFLLHDPSPAPPSQPFDVTGSTTSRETASDPLIWSTFIGGSGADRGRAVAVDAEGNTYATGNTFSNDFPTTSGAYNETRNGSTDVYISKISPDGSALIWSTYIGSPWGDYSTDIELTPRGEIVVTGYTQAGFPTTPGVPFQNHQGGIDAFILCLAADGSSLLWSTFFGGEDEDYIFDLDVTDDNITVVGYTTSTSFPTTPGAFNRTSSGSEDMFISRLNVTDGSIVWSTLLGGSDRDNAWALDLDPEGNIVVTGTTRSPDLPTSEQALDRTFNGEQDAFVAKLSSDGSSLIWSTFIGGGNVDEGKGIVVDPEGDVLVTGYTKSADLPTNETLDGVYGGNDDAFISRISGDGSSSIWSSYLGGSDTDVASEMDLDGSGNIIIVGYTSSTDFPRSIAAGDDAPKGGGFDIFLTKLSPEGSISFSTIIGGGETDWTRWSLNCLDLDPRNATITGETTSLDLPTTSGVFQENRTSGWHGFVVRVETIDADDDGFTDGHDDCPDRPGSSTTDRNGCPDGDADGWSDAGDTFPHDQSQWSDADGDGYGDNISGNQPDHFPEDPSQWNDTDQDGYGDNPEGDDADDCPKQAGNSTENGVLGCPDTDGDGWSDLDEEQAGTDRNDPLSYPGSDENGIPLSGIMIVLMVGTIMGVIILMLFPARSWKS
jgi:hypothetical protein